jgi:hypothetical protein
MNVVTRSSLRITIYNIINEAITVHESKENEFYNENFPVITKTEVMDFIETNPYFDEMLKIFLKDKFVEDVDAMIVSKEWREEFVTRVWRWVERYMMMF